jgi:hypothetical protein
MVRPDNQGVVEAYSRPLQKVRVDILLKKSNSKKE